MLGHGRHDHNEEEGVEAVARGKKDSPLDDYLLDEQVHDPSDAKLAEEWRNAIYAWTERVISLASVQPYNLVLFTHFLILQAISYIRTLYAFTNDTLAKYSYATSLQATLRYGILISLVQGLGPAFTYGHAICSCALQPWVRRFLISNGKANGGEIITALFAIILSGL
ncbi:hypothetical protein ZIOFF_069371 [Zingiber officinale]|uniref:Uncharacterized protein n=1 Tax=Zingiber officinale TaxID=94328 RepID=A0A8J5C5U5_ZINOF|nr:hypothetical protein ZIOFF_069371 [Zingiber officinale]